MKNAQKPLLKAIYDVLVFDGVVKNSADFASALGYNAGHISTTMKSDKVLPKGIMDKLNSVYGISKEYMISNGANGTMFNRDGAHTKRQTIDNQSSKTKIGENNNNQLTNGLDLSSTKSETDMHRLINAIEKIANANEVLALTNADLAREVLSHKHETTKKEP